MKSSDVTADILFYLQDGKKHTYSQIAEEVECSISTVKRHIQSLTYKNMNIEILAGRIGGVRLIEQKVSVERLNPDDLQLIISKLLSLQDDNPRIKSFINKLATQKEIKENYYEIK